MLAALKGDRPAAPAARDITDLALILDCSGSMQELTKEGETKMEAAKRIVADLVKKIPAGLNLTFVVYGHEVFGGADDPRNCQAVKVVRPLGPLDEAGRAALLKYIATIKPTGATPIANAMRLAGTELAKNDALCGMVVLTDGLESCRGNPAGEAADLLANLKISFGVNVIGFGVKDADDVALAAIAEAGNGKYYNADSSEELAERMLSLATELIAVAKPPEVIDTSRRAVRVLKPEVDLPEMKSITLIEEKEAGSAVRTQLGSVDKYDDYLRIPSGTTKYAVLWEPKEGFSVFLLRDFSIPERRVIDVKPDTVLGMIQVDGTGDAKEIYAVKAGERSAVVTKVQQAKKYGEIMVVPAGKYDVYVDRSRIEEDLEVEAGKLVRLK
ncbi:MAG: VWA domain-containing protein [Pirellulaceae bacterium]